MADAFLAAALRADARSTPEQLRYSAGRPTAGPPMNIFKNTVVTLRYSLYDADGKLVEKSAEPIVYLHGGYDNIFPKVEQALASKSPGDKVSVTLEPEDGFGEFDESLIRIEDTTKFP